MLELEPGHIYELDYLKTRGSTIFTFHKDRLIHGEGYNGPSTQEVIRMCIARIKSLNKECPWWGNHLIIALLRGAIFLFEVRAILRKAHKAHGIENVPTGPDGHL